MHRVICSFRLPALCLFCLLLAGCSGKGAANKSNFDRISLGMSPKEVESLMGPPTRSEDIPVPKFEIGKGSGTPSVAAPKKHVVQVWEDDTTTFSVTFLDDMMKIKSATPKKSGDASQKSKTMGK